MTFDGLSQRAPRLVRRRPPHGSDLVMKDRTHALFRALYEFGWNGGIAVLDGRQPLWGTCGPLSGLQRPHEAPPLDLVSVVVFSQGTSSVWPLSA